MEKQQVWASRDAGGKIDAIFYGGPSSTSTETLDRDHPEVVAYEQAQAADTVPAVVSDRQFFQMLAISGAITKEEALAAVMTGAIPSALESIVAAIEDENEEFAVRMLLSGATQFRRDHPLAASIAAARGMSDEQLDEFWTAAAAL